MLTDFSRAQGLLNGWLTDIELALRDKASLAALTENDRQLKLLSCLLDKTGKPDDQAHALLERSLPYARSELAHCQRLHGKEPQDPQDPQGRGPHGPILAALGRVLVLLRVATTGRRFSEPDDDASS